jgi:hypothetical protein
MLYILMNVHKLTGEGSVCDKHSIAYSVNYWQHCKINKYMSRCIIPFCGSKVELDVLSLVQNLLEINTRHPHHKSTPSVSQTHRPMKLFALKPERHWPFVNWRIMLVAFQPRRNEWLPIVCAQSAKSTCRFTSVLYLLHESVNFQIRIPSASEGEVFQV